MPAFDSGAVAESDVSSPVSSHEPNVADQARLLVIVCIRLVMPFFEPFVDDRGIRGQRNTIQIHDVPINNQFDGGLGPSDREQ